MEVTYRSEGDYLIPNLTLKPKPPMVFGKFSHLRRKYLHDHRRVLYLNLLTSNKLNEHLRDIEQTAMERMVTITDRMAFSTGVTEELKASDPMKWIGLMNSIRSAAEEVILTELIYC